MQPAIIGLGACTACATTVSPHYRRLITEWQDEQGGVEQHRRATGLGARRLPASPSDFRALGHDGTSSSLSSSTARADEGPAARFATACGKWLSVTVVASQFHPEGPRRGRSSAPRVGARALNTRVTARREVSLPAAPERDLKRCDWTKFFLIGPSKSEGLEQRQRRQAQGAESCRLIRRRSTNRFACEEGSFGHPARAEVKKQTAARARAHRRRGHAAAEAARSSMSRRRRLARQTTSSDRLFAYPACTWAVALALVGNEQIMVEGCGLFVTLVSITRCAGRDAHSARSWPMHYWRRCLFVSARRCACAAAGVLDCLKRILTPVPPRRPRRRALARMEGC